MGLMEIHNSENYIATGNNKGIFQLYKLEEELITLQIHEFNKPITAIRTTDEFTLIGTSELIIYNIKSQQYEIVTSFTLPITSIFSRGQFLYCASEEATIQVFIIGKKTDKASLIIETYSFKKIEEILHTAPILNVVGDGEKIYYLDVKGRIIVYPSKESYDILSSSIAFKSYLFATEKNFIYCKTKEAFAVVVEMDFLIRKIDFSIEGGVLFIKGEDKIIIYNFNKRESIEEIETKCENMVFDENNNRLILFSKNGDIQILKGVLSDETVLYEQIKEIKFKDDGIIPKLVSDKEHNIYELGSESDDEWIQRIKKKKKEIYKVSDKLKKPGEEFVHIEGDALNLFEDEEESEETNKKYIEKVGLSKQEVFIPCYIQRNKTILLCWNKIGYLIKREGDLANFIDLKFHNNEIMDKRIRDVDGCIFGWFTKSGIVIGNKTFFKFISHEIEWSISENIIKGEIVFLTMSENFIICVTQQKDYSVNIIGLNGDLLFSFNISDFISLCCDNKQVVIFYSQLKALLLNINSFSVVYYDLIYISDSSFSFCVIEDDKIYYGNSFYIYLLFNGLSIKVLEVEGVPLSILDQHVVCLSKIDGGRLEPQPQIEYFKLKLTENLLNKANKEMSFDLVGTYSHNEEMSDDLPIHFRDNKNEEVKILKDEIICSIKDNFDIEIKKEDDKLISTPTKRYNPFKK